MINITQPTPSPPRNIKAFVCFLVLLNKIKLGPTYRCCDPLTVLIVYYLCLLALIA